MEEDNTVNYTGYESAFVPTPMGQPDPADGGDVKPNVDKTGTVTVDNKTPNVRKWNPLGEFASYTYQLSLYMITPDAYDQFIASGRQNINILNNLDSPCAGGGAYLIAQSGGINDTTSTRAAGFNLDYYIDNLRMKAAFSPQATGSATISYEMSFTITEPYGFSFVTNLKRAADAIAKYSKTRNIQDAALNAPRQFFILGIKFLGYDKEGNIVQPIEFEKNTSSPTNPGLIDRTFKRYFDIYITELKFKIDGRAIQYSITAAPIPVKEGVGAKRGLIDKGAQNLTGTTVEQILNALATKLNNDQDKQYKEKINYSFKFYGEGSDAIKNASIVSPADVEKAKWPMAKLKNQADGTPVKATKATPISTERVISFERSVPIVQAISQIVTQSTYLTDGLKALYKPTNQPDPKTDNYSAVEIQSEATVKWINISPLLTNPRWDKQRNDYIFDITYMITPYDTPMIINPSLVDKAAPYKGPIKRYRYWYTGENSEIIRYEQTFNNSFYNTVLDPNYSLKTPSPIPNAGDKRTPIVRTGETGVGLEAQNSYITSLYEPGAWASTKIEILGDPDLLAYPSVSGDLKKYDTGQYNPYYAPDAVTVNPMSGQLFIEIDFKEAVDYNNGTGLMDINESIMFWKYPPEIAAKIKGVSYMISTVTSTFRGGKFTQELDLVVNAFFSQYEQAAKEREKARDDIDYESRRFANRANNNKPTGFVENTTPQNNTPGGDPCVRVPENQTQSPQANDDDSSGWVTTNPMGDFDPTSFSGDFTRPRGG